MNLAYWKYTKQGYVLISDYKSLKEFRLTNDLFKREIIFDQSGMCIKNLLYFKEDEDWLASDTAEFPSFSSIDIDEGRCRANQQHCYFGSLDKPDGPANIIVDDLGWSLHYYLNGHNKRSDWRMPHTIIKRHEDPVYYMWATRSKNNLSLSDDEIKDLEELYVDPLRDKAKHMLEEHKIMFGII